MKPYRVDFKYVVDYAASVYVIAADPDTAKAGAIEILEKSPGITAPEITSVEEYTPEQIQQALQ